MVKVGVFVVLVGVLIIVTSLLSRFRLIPCPNGSELFDRITADADGLQPLCVEDQGDWLAVYPLKRNLYPEVAFWINYGGTVKPVRVKATANFETSSVPVYIEKVWLEER